ncbi:MAG: anti-sigma factor antagonist [Acidobacteria bacterium]|nr:anti-sigma factor antagonist [Acidobacteriota bacterium]
MSFQSEIVKGVAVVRCRGRIMAGDSVLELRRELEKWISERKDVVLQLEQVSHIDSSGIGTLVRLTGCARAGHGDVKLCQVSLALRNVFEITNLLTVFEIFETEMEAIKAFHRAKPPVRESPRESAARILCIDRSTEVLAYLRALLQSAGYEVHTTSLVPDARTLLQACRINLVIVGASMQTAPQQPALTTWQKSNPDVVFLPLGEDFSVAEGGDAGAQVVMRVRAILASRT